MKFVMKVDLGNAVFFDDDGGFDPGHELYKILREAAGKARDGHVIAMAYDTNGNKVGSWEIEE